MSIENRPYVGTWSLNNKKVVRYTPDCLVYVNGDLGIPGCPSCNGRIDLQKYITQVSVDPSTEPPASASISLHIPKHTSDSFWRDGQFLLHPGLEINIYMRGYFPVRGISGGSEQEGDLDLSNAVVYPYYHVFHGVVTEVSHDYSGGEHTASLSCADLLHFWQFHRMSTNASVFGARPHNSKNRMSLMGHNFRAMTPYAIIYSLWRDLSGAAGGVEFALANETNAASTSTALDQSLFSMTMLYWEKRFSQSMFSLRMYGVDGTLYNAFQQAFLSNLSTSDLQSLAEISYGGKSVQDKKESNPFVRLARAVDFNPVTQWVASEASPNEDGEQEAGLHLSQMQAFVSDIGEMGNVNFFESQYETKMDIATTVRTLTGFEFYQDVDGDIVFKPPFYNLDTSDSRVYVIKPIDLISFSATETEPQATVVKGTGGLFRNMKGTGLEGEWGRRGEYIDYRLVAQYGWRQETFESEYYSDTRSLYFAAANRLDLFNISVKSASCSIPLRPELRPGYPVYIEHLDCFYYLQSFNHSFQYGGQCTTTLNLVGKRAKFLAPGVPPRDRSPTIDDIKLGNPFLPQLPLTIEGYDGIHRIQGFPNVVLALDPEMLNPLFFVAGANFNFDNLSGDPEQQLNALIRLARFGPNPILTVDYSQATTDDEQSKYVNGPFALMTGNGELTPIGRTEDLFSQLSSIFDAQEQVRDADAAAAKSKAATRTKAQEAAATALDTATANAEEINLLISAVQSQLASNFPEGESTAAYLDMLDDLKSNFAPNVPGHYRYYSSSHPDPEQQGQKEIVATEADGTMPGSVTLLEEPTRVHGFAKTADGGMTLAEIEVTAGLPIMKPGTKDMVPTPTHLIKTISFARHEVTTDQPFLGTSGERAKDLSAATWQEALRRSFTKLLDSQTFDASTTAGELFAEAYSEKVAAIEDILTPSEHGVSVPSLDDVLGTLPPGLPEESDADLGAYPIANARRIALAASRALARAASAAGMAWTESIFETFGAPGQDVADPAGRREALCQVQSAWDRLREALAPEEVVPGSAGAKVKSQQIKSQTKTYYSPVFPVSDERGYEVIGTYRYGRGLSIEVDGSFQALTEAEQLADDLGVDAVEEILDALARETDYAKAVGTLSPDTQAKLAESLNLETDGDAAEVLLSEQGKSLFEAQFSARASNSNQSTQKQTVTNAAYSLADLQNEVAGATCSCRGTDADTLLLAFNSENFMDLGYGDDVANYVGTQIRDKQPQWAASQAAMRGEVLDRDSAGAVSGVSDMVARYSDVVRQAGADLSAIGRLDNLRTAADDLANDVANFDLTEFTDEGG